MIFKETITKVKFPEVNNSFIYYMFYKEGDEKPEPNDDLSLFLGCDYATVVACESKAELDNLLNNITEEEYESLKNEFGYEAINVIEVNSVYLVALEIDYFEEEICDKIMSKHIVFGAQCDDSDIQDVLPYREKVRNGELKDLSFEGLKEAYQDGQFEEDEDLECSIDFYLRTIEYCGEQKEKLDSILDRIHNDLHYRE